MSHKSDISALYFNARFQIEQGLEVFKDTHSSFFKYLSSKFRNKHKCQSHQCENDDNLKISTFFEYTNDQSCRKIFFKLKTVLTFEIRRVRKFWRPCLTAHSFQRCRAHFLTHHNEKDMTIFSFQKKTCSLANQTNVEMLSLSMIS